MQGETRHIAPTGTDEGWVGKDQRLVQIPELDGIVHNSDQCSADPAGSVRRTCSKAKTTSPPTKAQLSHLQN